jgi:hypothetical protein
MMKKLMGLAALALLLSGCAVYPDYGHGHDRGRGNGYGNGGYGNGNGNGDFCPPGQAKKGNC